MNLWHFFFGERTNERTNERNFNEIVFSPFRIVTQKNSVRNVVIIFLFLKIALWLIIFVDQLCRGGGFSFWANFTDIRRLIFLGGMTHSYIFLWWWRGPDGGYALPNVSRFKDEVGRSGADVLATRAEATFGLEFGNAPN